MFKLLIDSCLILQCLGLSKVLIDTICQLVVLKINVHSTQEQVCLMIYYLHVSTHLPTPIYVCTIINDE